MPGCSWRRSGLSPCRRAVASRKRRGNDRSATAASAGESDEVSIARSLGAPHLPKLRRIRPCRHFRRNLGGVGSQSSSVAVSRRTLSIRWAGSTS